MQGVSEIEVKYLTDCVNDGKKSLATFDTSNNSVDTVQETLEGMQAIWNTVGGVAKIKKMSANTSELDTTRIATAVNELQGIEASYSKVTVLQGIEWKRNSYE